MIKQKRILLVQLVSMGDCLYVTALARQIKQDYPGCHLTWAISNHCAQVIQNNPYVDEIWEVFLETMQDAFGNTWEETKKKAIEKKEKGLYDYIFFTQIYPDNFLNYDGTIRSSTFRGYPNSITVPVAPIIRLIDKEIENVTIFAKRYKLDEFKHVILFESSPSSLQSPVNNNFATAISKKIVDKFEDAIVLLTSNQKINTGHKRIIDASTLTFRENAELSKYCNLLIGCSSGITWLLTSTWAKKIPFIQILKKKALIYQFASVSYDLNYWGQSTDHIIEITKFEDEYIFDCVEIALKEGIGKARKKYNERLKPCRKSLVSVIATAVYTKKYKKIIEIYRNFYDRNRDLLAIIVVLYAVVRAITHNAYFHHIHLGYIYAKEGKFDDAINEYNKALTLGPPDKNMKCTTHYRLGSIYEKTELFDKAEEEFKTVLELTNEVISIEDKKEFAGGAHFHLGCIYKELGKEKEAKQHFEECLKVIPTHKKAKENLKKGLYEEDLS
ncbi:tetratricopeptide repeat protein [bacterium]|nr:tetratricopeptide repeat protein [bacterium]